MKHVWTCFYVDSMLITDINETCTCQRKIEREKRERARKNTRKHSVAYLHHGKTESAEMSNFFQKSDHLAPNSALRGKLLPLELWPPDSQCIHFQGKYEEKCGCLPKLNGCSYAFSHQTLLGNLSKPCEMEPRRTENYALKCLRLKCGFLIVGPTTKKNWGQGGWGMKGIHLHPKLSWRLKHKLLHVYHLKAMSCAHDAESKRNQCCYWGVRGGEEDEDDEMMSQNHSKQKIFWDPTSQVKPLKVDLGYNLRTINILYETTSTTAKRSEFCRDTHTPSQAEWQSQSSADSESLPALDDMRLELPASNNSDLFARKKCWTSMLVRCQPVRFLLSACFHLSKYTHLLQANHKHWHDPSLCNVTLRMK